MWPGPNLLRFSHIVLRRSGSVIVRFALSGEAAFGTLLCVVLLSVFHKEEFSNSSDGRVMNVT